MTLLRFSNVQLWWKILKLKSMANMFFNSAWSLFLSLWWKLGEIFTLFCKISNFLMFTIWLLEGADAAKVWSCGAMRGMPVNTRCGYSNSSRNHFACLLISQHKTLWGNVKKYLDKHNLSDRLGEIHIHISMDLPQSRI